MKSSYILLLLTLLATAFTAVADQDTASAKLSDFKLPQYNEKGKLVFILYGKSGHSAGINVFLEQVIIDMVQSNVKDIDTVKDFSAVKIYDIETPSAEVAKFWSDKPHSAALIASPGATFDRAAQTVKGDRQINLRSPSIDIDGDGFDGEYVGKTLHIRKNVKIVIRQQLTKGVTANAGKTAEKDQDKESLGKTTSQKDAKGNKDETAK